MTRAASAAAGIVAEPAARRELTEDVTARAARLCRTLRDRSDVPDHIRNLTSDQVLSAEADRQRRHRHARTAAGRTHCRSRRRARRGATRGRRRTRRPRRRTRHRRRRRHRQDHDPRRRAPRAQPAGPSPGRRHAFSAAKLIHQHGFRWDADGHWSRVDATPDARARLLPGDVLLVDEAGMLDQDTARALFAIADKVGATIALLGDRHQLPAVGRGGVLDLAAS